MTDGVPIIGLWHSGGARLAEGVLSLHAVGRIFQVMTQASGQDPADLRRARPGRRRRGLRPRTHRRGDPRPRGTYLRHRPRRGPLRHRRGRRHAPSGRSRAARPPLRRRAHPRRVRAARRSTGPARSPSLLGAQGSLDGRVRRGPRPRRHAAGVQEARVRRAPARRRRCSTRAPCQELHATLGPQHRHRARPLRRPHRRRRRQQPAAPRRLPGLARRRRRRPASCGCATPSACR